MGERPRAGPLRLKETGMRNMLQLLGRLGCAALMVAALGVPQVQAQSTADYDSVTFSSSPSGSGSGNRYGFGGASSGYSETDTGQTDYTPPAPQYEQVSTAQSQRAQRNDWSAQQAQASQTYGTPPSYSGAPQSSANDPYSLGGTYVPPPSNAQPYQGAPQRIDAQPQYQQPQAQPQYQPAPQPAPQPQAQPQAQPQPQYQPAPQAAPQPQRSAAPAPQAQMASRPVQQMAPRPTAASEYKLGPGDQLQIIVFGHDDLSGPRTVDGSGYIAMPLVERIRAQGMSPRQLEAAITRSLSPDYLRDPRVAVEVLNYRPFFILGEVAKTGRYEYAEGITVIEAIALAGGFTYRASKGSVTIRRYGEQQEQKASPQTVVLPGDIINVPDRGLF